MGNSKIVDFIASYIEKLYNESKPTIIKNYSALRDDYIPKELPFREEHLKNIARFIFSSVRGSTTSTLNIYGPTGTGKTVSIKYIESQFRNFIISNKLPIRFIYINTKFYSTGSPLYSFIKTLVAKLTHIPPKDGAKYSELIDILLNYLESTDKKIILALDEIDALFKDDPNDILYTILRSGKITLITISNNLSFLRKLDARVNSSMVSIKLPFHPYNASQLYTILLNRAKEAFYPNTYETEAINYLAAKVAKDSGDARQAISLLRNAAEMAQANGDSVITIDHIREAINLYESELFIKEIEILPIQFKLVALSILLTFLENEDNFVDANDAFEKYKELCVQLGESPQSKQSFLRKIRELETYLYGFIEGGVVYKGRQGKRKIIIVNIEREKISKIVEKLLS